jgi:hypothetical protein
MYIIDEKLYWLLFLSNCTFMHYMHYVHSLQTDFNLDLTI